MSNEIKIREFDISNIKEDSVITLIGKRRSGKSFCMKDILYHLRNIPQGIVMSGTENSNSHYGTFIPPAFVHNGFDKHVLEKLMLRQKRMTYKKKSMPGYSDLDNRAFFIMDDLMYDSKTWLKDKNIKEIFMNARHFSLFYAVLLQYSLGIPPALRGNVDYIFIFRENNKAFRRRLYENWAGCIGSYELFCQIMDTCTEDFGCIVIDNTTRSNNLEEQVFYYKAKDHGNFKMCSNQSWSFSEKYHTDNTESELFQNNIQEKQSEKFKVILE